VVLSHPSLDEAAGDAAVRADPDDAGALAAAVREALARRDDLVERGRSHARRFTWLATGRVRLPGYAEALCRWLADSTSRRSWTRARQRRGTPPASSASCEGARTSMSAS